jgi:quinolinate synthase
MKALHPEALVMVHPECSREVPDLADEVLSTGQMVSFAASTEAKKIIVGTEIGMLHKLKAAAPHIEFIAASPDFICPSMKMITPEKLYMSLLNEETVIAVNDSVREKAGQALNRMLGINGLRGNPCWKTEGQ